MKIGMSNEANSDVATLHKDEVMALSKPTHGHATRNTWSVGNASFKGVYHSHSSFENTTNVENMDGHSPKKAPWPSCPPPPQWTSLWSKWRYWQGLASPFTFWRITVQEVSTTRESWWRQRTLSFSPRRGLSRQDGNPRKPKPCLQMRRLLLKGCAI